MISASKQPKLKLNNGAQMPQFGIGTFQHVFDELKTALRAAFDCGYRLIDTAHIYQNEHVIGEVLEEYIKAGKLKRADVFITTKLPFYAMSPEEAEAIIPKQLEALRTDYVDLYLVHGPMSLKPMPGKPMKLDADCLEIHDNIEHIDIWRVLEKWNKKGALKALGISNFNARQIESLYKLAEIKPANLQVECHIFWPQKELFDLTKKLGMIFTAYGPLGSPGRKSFGPGMEGPDDMPMANPLVVELAKKYKRTPAQVLLRQMLQRGIATIPKSTNEKRLKENATIFDFELTAEEMAKFEKIDNGKESRHFPYDDVKDR